MNKEEAAKAAKMSWQELNDNYPKATMVIDYISKHYPNNVEQISKHRMLPSLIFSNYSNTEIESMIDKLAIFNGWQKYAPLNTTDITKGA